MKRIVTLATLATVLAAPAFAGGGCSTAPASKFQPVATLQTKLEGAGYTVRQIKTEGGCYEVYAIDQNGNRVNGAFNAETLAPVENAEAGEG